MSQVYATLLTNNTYLPGALVLAHSLRDAGSTKELAVLVTPETVSAETINQLRTIYNYIIEVPRISNPNATNLNLMQRLDLHSALTKINLWKQIQFDKIVYIDADVVAVRAPDELFDLDVAFAAAPDIGWPDCFNSGVMVLKPSIDTYNELKAMADAGATFDGADQGLLNAYFTNFHRISFNYNVTPSAHYQYLPAYNHFRGSISLVHFIGKDKPWVVGRSATNGSTPYHELTSKWFSVFDKHYGVQGRSANELKISEAVRRLVLGEYGAASGGYSATGYSSWDASRSAPPMNSGPEAGNFPTQVYSMSTETQVTGWAGNSGVHAAIFPWEQERRQAMPTRIFWDDPAYGADEHADEIYEDEDEEEIIEAASPDALEESENVEHELEPSGALTPTPRAHGAATSNNGSNYGDDGLLTPSETTLSYMTSPTAAASSGPNTPPQLSLAGYFEQRKNTAVASKPPAVQDWTCVHGEQYGAVDCLCEVADVVFKSEDPLPMLKTMLKDVAGKHRHQMQYWKKERVAEEGEDGAVPMGTAEEKEAEVPMFTTQTYLGRV